MTAAYLSERRESMSPPSMTLSGDIGRLQKAFNRDADKVRVLLLVSPT